MTVLSQIIGNYSQTIRIGYKNEVEVKINGEVVFKGEATHIIDNGNKLSFKDKDGKQYEFVKFNTYSYI